jgi:hypothetical protein
MIRVGIEIMIRVFGQGESNSRLRPRDHSDQNFCQHMYIL